MAGRIRQRPPVGCNTHRETFGPCSAKPQPVHELPARRDPRHGLRTPPHATSVRPMMTIESLRAREILDNWATARAKFVKVFPKEYRRALGELAASRSKAA